MPDSPPSSPPSSSPPKKRHARSRRRRGRARPRPATGDDAPLHLRCTTHFRAGDQQRGEKYFQQQRVQLQVDGQRARASVRGSERPAYSVGLDWSRVETNHRLHAFCECERFVGGSPCKHVWATLLAFADQHAAKQPKGKDRLGLRKDRLSSWSDLELSNAARKAPTSKEKRAKARSTDSDTSRSKRRQPRPRRSKRGNPTPTWRSQLHRITQEMERLAADSGTYGRVPKGLELQLLVNTSASLAATGLVIDIFGRRQTAAGKTGKLRRTSIDLETLDAIFQGLNNGAGIGTNRVGSTEAEAADATSDHHVPAVIAALPPEAQKSQGGRGRRPKNNNNGLFQQLRIPRTLYSAALPPLCRSGALRHWDGRRLGDPAQLEWDQGHPWTLLLQLEFAAAGRMRLRGMLERPSDGEEAECVPLSKAVMVLPIQHDGAAFSAATGVTPSASDRALLLLDDSLGHIEIDAERDLPWIKLLREEDELIIPEDGVEEAVTSLLEMPRLPRLETPEGLQLNDTSSSPHPKLSLHPEDTPEWMNPQLVAELSFTYGGQVVDAGDPRPAAVDWEHGTYARRDIESERTSLVRLLELGFKPIAGGAGDGLELDPLELPAVAEALLIEGWDVEAHGTTIRPPAPPALRVESNVDWFELSGQVDYNGNKIDLAKILAAIRRGDRTIDLKDGSKGLVPESWMDTYGSLADLAQEDTEEEGNLRFLPSQALLVDGLLAAMPPANVDRAFKELREKLRSFEAIKPKKEPRGFRGTLRSYQRSGLGWLCFLREFGLGGVLADDMGLGKTVQALALLKTFRTKAKTTGKPYLVVAPRSLVYNWMDETKRFVPTFKCVEYSGPGREAIREKINDYDLVLTTYGTLRRDIGFLATVEFDTVILDEAQAIKNPESQTAKASRLLRGQNRLALTGTPIENHIGELGSIFEFLNPGLLGRLPALEVLAGGRVPSKDELALVATGIRPFILRRTKEEVLPDLPEKTEQVLQCELNPEQRAIYDQLAASYRENLLHEVESKGVGGNAMQVLEALLRLRQIACHPGLVSDEWKEAGSSKLEMLHLQVKEVLAEGHKLVVFSQFTSLLALVREEFDSQGQTYAYLDGQTRDRGEVVERFQTDPECNLFLISLKAGGVGLNLTAASYVFLLDPWWNPAVEAQAIDRAHRIGQNQKVFAYRLIAKDTVEEKMLELQKSKRKIADAILDGEGQSLRDLTSDDLRMLLS